MIFSVATTKSPLLISHKKCTLPNPIFGTINGKVYCFATLSKKGRTEGEKACKASNGYLPLPKSDEETKELVQIISKMGTHTYKYVYYKGSYTKVAVSSPPQFIYLNAMYKTNTGSVFMFSFTIIDLKHKTVKKLL